MGFDLQGPTHPDTHTLLAWAEGELRWWRAALVRRHVRSCWQCRAEVGELEAMIAAVSLGVAQLPEPSKVDVNRAWWRFRDAVRERYPDAGRERVRAARLNWPRLVGASALLATVGLAYVASVPLFRREVAEPSAAASPPAVRREFTAPVLRPRVMNVMPAAAPPAVEFAAPAIPKPGYGSSSSEEELTEAEVRAVEAIHRSGLCRNSGISVRRVDGAVEVSGMARSRDQRVEIETLLAGIVKVRVMVPEDVVLPPASSAAVDSSAGSETETRSGSPPIPGWLSLRGRPGLTERDLFNLMNSMALASEKASSEAWALRRLAEQFPESKFVSMNAELRATVLRMVEDHTVVLENDLTSLHGKLAAATGTSVSASAAVKAAGESWESAALGLQGDVEGLVRFVLASLSSDGADTRVRSLGERTESCISMAGSLRADLQTRSAAVSRRAGR